MDRALVVLSESDTGKELLGEAAELAAGVDAELVCLSVLTEEEYDHDIDVLTMLDQAEGTTSHGGGRSFEEEGREELARNEGERLVRPVLEESGVDYEIVGQVVNDDVAAAIVEAATDADCDHVFLVGNRRSPVGKAVFGDVAQTVILDFDGPVTVEIE